MKKIILSICLVVSFAFTSVVYGASSKITANKSSANIGDTIVVSATVSGVAAWNISISASGPVTFVSGYTKDADSTSDAQNGTKTISATYKVNALGDANFALSGDARTQTQEKVNVSSSCKVSIVERVSQNNNTNTNNNNTNNNSSNNSNANLKRLVPNYEGLSPNFSSNVTKYSLSVPENATSVKFTAVPEVTGAKYWITGDENLKLGDNTVTITVTAKDGTKKSYTVIVTRAADANKANAYLNNIIVDGNELNPVFAAENLEYTLKDISGEVEKLNILAYAKSEKAKIEIIGNEKLVAGENNIKILVTAEDGVTTKEYILKVKKEEVSVTPTISNETGNENINIYDEVNAYKNTDNGGKLSRILGAIRANLLVIILYIFVLVEFAQIMYLYKKVNKIDNISKSDDIISDENFMAKEETLDDMDKLDTNFEKTETPTKRRR